MSEGAQPDAETSLFMSHAFKFFLERFLNKTVPAILVLLVLSSLSALAQKKTEGNNNRVVYGQVLNQVTRKTIVGARLYRYNADSILVDTAVTDHDNNVNGERDVYVFFCTKEGGRWRVRVEADGYETQWITLTARPYKSRELLQAMPDIVMKKAEKDVQLGSAVVKATKIKFYTRGDTVVYNADAFNLAEGSMLDALIKQLPGAELKSDGQIFVNGEKVDNLLLNGDDFFKGNHKLMLDNLPAYTVKDLQIFRKRNKLSEFAGHDVGQKELSINVRLKKEYRQGWFANIEGGAGTHDRYLGRLFAMRFTDHSKLTLFGNLNNLNDDRRPEQDDQWNPDLMPDGRVATKTGGLNYSVDDRLKRFKIDGSADVKHTSSDNLSRSTGENFLTQGNTYRMSESHALDHNTAFHTEHDLVLGKNPLSRKDIEWEASYRHWRSSQSNAGATFSENPFDYGHALLDSIRRPGAGALLRRMALNRSVQETLGKGHEYKFSLNPNLMFKSVATDVLGIEADVQYEGRSEENFANALYDYPSLPAASRDFRRQYKDQNNYKQTYDASLYYVFIFPNALLVVPKYTVAHARYRERSPLFRLDSIDGWGADSEHDIGMLPSAVDALRTALDYQNSYRRHTTLTTNDVGLQINWNSIKNTEKSYWSVHFDFTGRLNYETLSLQRADYDGRTSRHYVSWHPLLQLRHSWKNFSRTWRFEYKTDFEPLDMAKRIDVLNTEDPLNIYRGNVRLKDAMTHNLSTYFRLNDKKAQRFFYIGGSYRITHNAAAYGYTYDRTTGVRTYIPDNVNGNYLMSFNTIFNTPLDKKKRLMLNERFDADYRQSVDLWCPTESAGDVLEPVRSTVHTTSLGDKLSLTYQFGKNKVGLSGGVNWNRATSRRDNFSTVNIWGFNYGLSATLELPWDVQLSTSLSMYSRRGYDSPEANSNDLLWNGRLTKRLLHGKMTVMLDGFDILGQLSNVTHTLDAQGRFETYRNTLPSYGLLHITYRFSKKAKDR